MKAETCSASASAEKNIAINAMVNINAIKLSLIISRI